MEASKNPSKICSWEIDDSEENVSVSTKCKVCHVDFEQSTIYKHISHKPSCRAKYSNEEIKVYQEWARDKRNERKREAYEPVKSKKSPNNQIGRQRPKMAKLSPKSSKEENLKKCKDTSNINASKDTSTSDKPKDDSDANVVVSTKCKVCHVDFEQKTIYKHISNKASCKAKYSNEEIKVYQEWARDRRNEKRRKSYDPVKSRNKYHEKVGKFIEKQSDRESLKGRSFTKVFEKYFIEATERFRLCLRQEARSIVKEEENYNDVRDKTLDSVFDCDLWKKEATKSYVSQDCEYINGLRKDPHNIYDCQSKPEVPCLCHCSDSVLYDIIEAGMQRAFENSLEENITSISKSIAFKAWDKPPGFERKLFGWFKGDLYKKVFAKFYHDESFLQAYEEAYNHSTESVMASNEVCYEETTSFVDMHESVEKYCEKKFERILLNLITDEPNIVFKEKLDAFIDLNIKTTYPLDAKLKNIWREWLKKEKIKPLKEPVLPGGFQYTIWPFSAV